MVFQIPQRNLKLLSSYAFFLSINQGARWSNMYQWPMGQKQWILLKNSMERISVWCSKWINNYLKLPSCCSFTKSCSTLWDTMDDGTPGFPVLHCLLELGCPIINLCIFPDVVVYSFRYLLLSGHYVQGNLLGIEK